LQRNENGEGIAEGEGKTGGSRALLRKTVIRIRGNFKENFALRFFNEIFFLKKKKICAITPKNIQFEGSLESLIRPGFT